MAAAALGGVGDVAAVVAVVVLYGDRLLNSMAINTATLILGVLLRTLTHHYQTLHITFQWRRTSIRRRHRLIPTRCRFLSSSIPSPPPLTPGSLFSPAHAYCTHYPPAPRAPVQPSACPPWFTSNPVPPNEFPLPDPTWYMDTGATSRMASDAGILSYIFNNCSSLPEHVIVGNGPFSLILLFYFLLLVLVILFSRI